MSKAAADIFIAAVKTTRADFDNQTGAFYKKFVAGKDTPTAADAKKLADIIAKMEDVAKHYHIEVSKAMQGFGGPSDTTIGPTKTLHQTVLKKIRK